jgi:hypothetical protein
MVSSPARVIAILCSVLMLFGAINQVQNKEYHDLQMEKMRSNESIITTGSREASRQKIRFIAYGNDRFAKSKKRIVQEAIGTGWFDTAKAYGPEDLPASIYEKDQYAKILALPRGGGYWLWEFPLINQVMDTLSNGDFLIYSDAGSTINKDGEVRFREYINMVNNSQYDLLAFELPSKYVEYKWTTQRLFLAYDSLGNASITQSAQFASGALVMQKGPHFRKWMDLIYREVLDVDPWLITDKYNDESREMAVGFIDNRHDQSVKSIAKKIIGCVKLPYADIALGLPGKPFHVTRLKE